VGFWAFLKTRPGANSDAHSSQHHNVTTSQTCEKFNRPPAASLSNQTQLLHQLYSYQTVSDSWSIVSIKRATPDNIISDASLAFSLPSPNNWQITPSCRRREISGNLDSKDTMKALDSETVINLSQ
jgi:hypothetical protein